MIKKISRFCSSVFKREKAPTPAAICATTAAYFFGALTVYKIDPVFLLAAWLMGGFLLITVYVTFDRSTSLLNPYTLSLTGGVAACLIGYLA